MAFDLRSPGWEPTVIALRIHSDNITDLLNFYIPIHKGMTVGITLEKFHSNEAV